MLLLGAGDLEAGRLAGAVLLVVVVVMAAQTQLLRLGEAPVGPVGLGHEAVVGAPLDDAAAVQHGDVVGALDRRQPVRDQQRRPVQRRLHYGLAVHVDGARRLVENEDLGLLFRGQARVRARFCQ